MTAILGISAFYHDSAAALAARIYAGQPDTRDDKLSGGVRSAGFGALTTGESVDRRMGAAEQANADIPAHNLT